MIQIIGFLLCAALAVKLLEMGANPAYKADGDKLVPGIGFALVFGWCAVAGFLFWLLAQGAAFPKIEPSAASYTPMSETQMACVENAKTDAEVLACNP